LSPHCGHEASTLKNQTNNSTDQPQRPLPKRASTVISERIQLTVSFQHFTCFHRQSVSQLAGPPTFGSRTLARFPAIMALSAVLCSCTILEPQRWPAQSGRIILTFDDGPNGDGVSEALLDVLRKHKVPAAFGLIGESVRASPHIVQRIKDEGHDIINHTYSHHRSFFSASALDLEIIRADQAIASALSDPGYRTTRFRPPYGLITPAIYFSPEVRRRQRAYLTFYIDDAGIGPRDAEQLLEKTKRRLMRSNGGAIVLHESRYPPTRAHVPDKSWLPSAIEDLIVWAHARTMTFTKYE
jgi:peptidoglycan-N-acetylglucosamine deacetylase